MTCESCTAADPCNPTSSGKQLGKVFLYLASPSTTLAAGYTHIAIEHSRDGGATWRRITSSTLNHERAHLKIESDQSNYVFVVTCANPWHLYRPVLVNVDTPGTPVDLPQTAREAVDTSYEAIWTIEEVKRVYLTGVDLTNDQNVPYPDEIFAHSIRAGIDRMEHEIDIPLQPLTLEERYDFWRNEWERWGFVQLRQRPVIDVTEVALLYPSTESPLIFPADWYRVDRHAGEVRIVPGSGTISSFFVTAGARMPFVGYDHLPDLIRIKYAAGFELGTKSPRKPFALPSDVKEIVGMWGSMGPLNIAGDLIAGAAIASKSIGIDGLSQSVNTTASATNAGYGSRLIQYEKQVKAVLPTIRRYYKGGRMIIV